MHLKFLPFFNQPDPEQEFTEEEEEIEEDLSYLKITMKQDMSLDIESWWNSNPDYTELAFAFGTLLKFLTNGGYDILIANNLAEALIDGDKTTEDFINQVLDVWKNGEDFKEMQTKLAALPVISPLKTFSESNFGG